MACFTSLSRLESGQQVSEFQELGGWEMLSACSVMFLGPAIGPMLSGFSVVAES